MIPEFEEALADLPPDLGGVYFELESMAGKFVDGYFEDSAWESEGKATEGRERGRAVERRGGTEAAMRTIFEPFRFRIPQGEGSNISGDADRQHHRPQLSEPTRLGSSEEG